MRGTRHGFKGTLKRGQGGISDTDTLDTSHIMSCHVMLTAPKFCYGECASLTARRRQHTYPAGSANLSQEQRDDCVGDASAAAHNIRGTLPGALHVGQHLLEVAGRQLLQ